MALITEDGTGIDDAESYASVEEADAYHSDRENTAWADAEPTSKEAALRKATDFIETVYGPRFFGERLVPSQNLSFPRDPVSWDGSPSWDGVPPRVVRATAELALRVVKGVDLMPDSKKEVTKAKTDVLETTYALATGPRFPFIEAMLSPLAASLTEAEDTGNPWVNLVRV